MYRNWALYIVLVALGLFLVSSSYINNSFEDDNVQTEQNDNHSNDNDEHESKRSLDDEVFIHTHFLTTTPVFWTAIVHEFIEQKLPQINLSLHCPPPELV